MSIQATKGFYLLFRNPDIMGFSLQLVEQFFHLWQKRLEEREDADMLPQIEHAGAHFSASLLMKMIDQWKKYTEWRRMRKVSSHFPKRVIVCTTIIFPGSVSMC
jgi:hypothetical protein